MMRNSLEHDTEGLLPKERLSESKILISLHANHRVLNRWREYLTENPFSAVVITLLSFSNIITLCNIVFLQATKEPYLLSVNQPPGGVPPTFAHLVRKPTPTFVNVSWYAPENSFFRQHNSVEADEKWKWYDASSEFHTFSFLARF